MKKSIFWALGFVLFLSPLFSGKSLPSHARRSSILSAVGGTCTRYSCATYEGFKRCLSGDPSRYTPLEVHTKKEDNAVFGIYRDHPNCYRSFCIANCMLPPGIEESMDPQRRGDLFTIDEGSEVERQLNRLKKEAQRDSYMRDMNQFIKNKKINCTKRGLGPIMRRLCSFCGSASLSSEGYKMIQDCEARAEDFSENPQQRLGRLVRKEQRQQSTGGSGTFGMIAQAGTQLVRGTVDNLHAQGGSAWNQGTTYLADQGRNVQGHIKAGSRQVSNARKEPFERAQDFGNRVTGRASKFTGSIQAKKEKLTGDYRNFKRDAKKRETEIRNLPGVAQRRALRNLEERTAIYEKTYQEKLRDLEDRTSEGEEERSEVGDRDVDFEGLDEEYED